MNGSRTAVVSASLLLLGGAACGAPWEFNPTIEAGALYDDNYHLREDGAELDVSGALLDAQVELRSLMPASEFSLTPRVRATYFPDDTELDSQDYFAIADWQRRGQRVQSRVRLDLSEQDVVNSEQPDADVDTGLGEPVLGDSGLVVVRNRRLRGALRPEVTFELSPRKQLQLNGGYTDVSFDRQVPGAQVDFRTADLSAGLLSRISERSSLTTRLRGAYYDIETLGSSTAYGAEVQWDTRNVSETRWFVRAGAQNTELPDGETEITWLAGAGLSFLLGRNEIFADIARSVGPSSAGVLITRDQLRVRLTHTFSPRLSLLAGLRGSHDDAVDSAIAFSERSYATGDVGMQWRIQEELALRFAYDYTWQEFSGVVSDVDAASSGATLTVLYQPQRRR